MKKTLRILALLVVVGALAFWAAKGGNRGWTRNQEPVKTLDPVTGIEGITYEKRFVPGVDFLLEAVALAAVLAGASFLFRGRSKSVDLPPGGGSA